MTERWLDVFALSQFNAGKIRMNYSGRTVRVVIKNHAAGSKIRLTLSNRFGRKYVEIKKVSVAACDADGRLKEQPTYLKFNNESYCMVSPKSGMTSDDMDYQVKEGFLAVSIYFGSKAKVSSFNMLREKVQLSVKGDYTGKNEIVAADTLAEKLVTGAFKLFGMPRIDMIPLLESVTVYSDKERGSVLAFGDSITQGGKWTYALADKLDAPVINLGIGGNRLLRNCSMPLIRGIFGEGALKRYDRDILTRYGAKAVIVMIGTNDIGQPGTISAKRSHIVTSEDIIKGLTSIALRAKAAGLKVFVCTLTPFKHFRMGYIGRSYETRLEVNEWIRNNKVYDGYYDFDAAVRDIEDSEMLDPACDSGDHLHPSDAGSIKMSETIDTDVLREIISEK